jgi:AraC-like DNA-binding protein
MYKKTNNCNLVFDFYGIKVFNSYSIQTFRTQTNMHIESNIGTLYKPIQPTVTHLVDNVAYTEFRPDTALQPYIYCYWQLKTTQPLTEPFRYRVVADACMDIFFDLNNPQENFVMGCCKKFTEFELDNTFHYIGIRFLPTMFPQLFKVSAIELSNCVEPLRMVVPHFSAYISTKFNSNQNPKEIKTLIDKFFLDYISNTTFYSDNRLYDAISIILRTSGMLHIEKNLNTGISTRQLRRLFDFYVGENVKTFSNIIRFQHLLNSKPTKQHLHQYNAFYDFGYYDQSHFIKEFKKFYGITPGKLGC